MSTIQDGILAEAVEELAQVRKSVKALPQELKQATQELRDATQTASDYAGKLEEKVKKTIDASVEMTKAELAKAVAHTAEKVAYNASRKRMLQWAAICFAASAFLFFGIGLWMYLVGTENGYQKGRSHGDYDQQVYAWSQSPEGQMARSLANIGVLRSLVLCEGPGWQIETKEAEGKTARFCVPKPIPLSDKDKTPKPWGWQIP